MVVCMNGSRSVQQGSEEVSTESQNAVAAPAKPRKDKKAAQNRPKPKQQPRYHVILWDDDDHSYEYVVGMMRALFGHQTQYGFQIAKEVDNSGRAICLTTTLEHAELKRDQIHAFGHDPAIRRCQGAMSASIEAETS